MGLSALPIVASANALMPRTISDLQNRHQGESAFCLGTAPHLNQINLDQLKGQVTIVCNQLVELAEKLEFSYACFQNNARFESAKAALPKLSKTVCVIPDSIARRQQSWISENRLEERLIPVHHRLASPGNAESFSFDLANCVYAGDVMALQVQLAVWMGCNPIYVLGVDAAHEAGDPFYFDARPAKQEENYQQYYFPELKEWLAKARTLLWARGIKLLNAAGMHSSLDVLPRTRLNAALGKPRIAISSKTFSQDAYLVWELKRYFPEIKLNEFKDTLKDQKLVEFLSDVDGLILGTENFSADVMQELPCLRCVSKYGVGLDNVDFDAARRNQIEVSYQKGVNSDSVAELTLTFLLMLLRKVDQSVQAYRSNKWSKLPGRELAEITLGIIGYGNVGKVVARKLSALGLGRILVHDILDFPVTRPLEFVPLDYLLSESDVVSLHISSERTNYHFVNAEFLQRMKDGAILINTARGDILDSKELVAALKSGKLAGAALDVYEDEPNPNRALMTCENLITTCHIAGSSNRAIKNMGWAAIEGLVRLFNLEGIS